MARAQKFVGILNPFAFSLPGAYEASPWGECVAKVGRKIFVWLPQEEKPDARITVKLGDSHAFAASLPGVVATGYGLGKAGWLTITLRATGVPSELFLEWIEESYRLIAPKKLVAELDGG